MPWFALGLATGEDAAVRERGRCDRRLAAGMLHCDADRLRGRGTGRITTGVAVMNSKHYLPAGSTGTHPFSVTVTPESAGWAESSLWIVQLGAGESVDRRCDDDEILVVPLSGAASVSCEEGEFALAGRQSVFCGPTDFAYVGRDSSFRVTSADGAHVALCGARASRSLPFRHVPAADVPVELRGAGMCSREV